MRHIPRLIITVVAAFAVVFSGVALAQDDPDAERREKCEAAGGTWVIHDEGVGGCDTEVRYAQEECEAAGYLWIAEGTWSDPSGPNRSMCVDTSWTGPGAYQVIGWGPEIPPEPAPVEPVEQPPTTELPATQPTQAQPTAPTFTG